MKRIKEFEGLRFFLAFWVVIDHFLGSSGFAGSGQLSGLLQLLREGWYAVDIFIILSGFVIFYLLDQGKEFKHYRIYIVRRFLRLYPVFIVCFFAALALLNINVAIENAPDFLIDRITARNELYTNIDSNSTYHILAHLTLLHGIFPNEILYYSSSSYLGPAWSISLEWQFYLIAPLLLAALKSRRIAINLSFIVIMLGLYLIRKNVGTFPHEAFLPLNIEHFFVGILSYFLWKRKDEIGASINLRLFLFFSINTLVIFFIVQIPLKIWIPFFSYLLLFDENEKDVYGIYLLRKVFNNSLIQKLGNISYSIYLCHPLVIYVFNYVIFQLGFQLFEINVKKDLFFHYIILCTPLIILFSLLLNKYIEKPFIRFGKRFAKKQLKRQ